MLEQQHYSCSLTLLPSVGSSEWAKILLELYACCASAVRLSECDERFGWRKESALAVIVESVFSIHSGRNRLINFSTQPAWAYDGVWNKFPKDPLAVDWDYSSHLSPNANTTSTLVEMTNNLVLLV